ncbi:MAG: peptide chain release factor 2 [Candidatus Omnitrophota bacterium]|nr:MAG: peptide chain release factor 2 [Candidatus Omnitrophota bacterium]
MEEITAKLEMLATQVKEFKEILNIEDKKKKIEELQLRMSSPHFWQDQETSSLVIEELKGLKEEVESFSNLEEKIDELREIIDLGDTSYYKEVLKEVEKIEEEIKKIRLRVLFSEKFDEANAIVEINSGAGGTEACDWAGMLLRMYTRWAQKKGFKVRILNEVRGEEAGIKNVTFLVEGRWAFGYLKAEKGVHRLVRISPFDANRRRHTSFASVDVLPEVKEEVELKINPEDLKIETFRASGHGGQHINRTDSAVRITHLPSGIVVSCQNERSQYQNKQTALKVLKAKLYKLKEEEREKEMEEISGQKKKIEWGSQIRSYILHPYLLVKDHRTNFEVGRAREVLDGELDEFIQAYLIKSLEDGKKNSS